MEGSESGSEPRTQKIVAGSGRKQSKFTTLILSIWIGIETIVVAYFLDSDLFEVELY